MQVLRDRWHQPVLDSAGAEIQVALPSSTASGALELVGASREPGTAFVRDNHGERVLDSDGLLLLFIETPPGKAQLDAMMARRKARLAKPFVPLADAERREWEREMLDSWFLVERAQYFTESCQPDVTTFSHAARCGDAEFLQWAREQGLDAQFDWEDMRGYAEAYARRKVLTWIDEIKA